MKNFNAPSTMKTRAEPDMSAYRLALAAGSSGIIVMDNQKDCIYLDDIAYSILNPPTDDLKGFIHYFKGILDDSESVAFLSGATEDEPDERILRITVGDEHKVIRMAVVADRNYRTIVAIKDITEGFMEKENQRHRENNILVSMAESQHLAALGVLASGVAHEVNNIFSAVNGLLYLAESEETLKSKNELIHRAMIYIKSQGKIAQNIMNTVRDAEGGRQHEGSSDFAQVIGDVVGLVRMSAPNHIEIITTVMPSDIKLSIASTDLHRLLLNLIVNSINAIPADRAGKIHISAAVYENRTTTDCLMIKVHDNGVGIPKELQDKIFKPFFTTRTKSGGTGLGLSIVKDIVESAGGTINFKSDTSNGTTFKMILPCVQKEESEDFGQSESDRKLASFRKMRKVLLVEDDKAIGEIMSKIITRSGHYPLVSESEDNAMSLVEAHPDIALAILDVYLRQGNGVSVAGKLKEISPATKIILMTGDSQAYAEVLKKNPLHMVYQKPISISEIHEMIGTLDDPAESPAKPLRGCV